MCSTIGCGCRGIRSCLVCESSKRFPVVKSEAVSDEEFYQCYRCGHLLGNNYSIVQKPLRECADGTECILQSCLSTPDGVALLGREEEEETSTLSRVVVVKEFITTAEEDILVHHMDSLPWAESQSGRKKQDYGPKVNFNKSRVKLGSFNGLPPHSRRIVSKLADIELLKGFYPVELCNLDYDPARGAVIEPHRDDSWIWGERLVTVNLLSPTYLSFTHPSLSITMHIPLPSRSLVIVMGVARHVWSHSIRRENVIGRRVAMTMRELGNDFLEGHKDQEIGKELRRIAQCYDGSPVNFS